MNTMREKLSGAHAAVRGAASGARNRVQSHIKTAQDKFQNGDYTDLHRSIRDYVVERSNANIDALKEAGFGMHDQAGEMWERRKKEAEKRLFEMAAPVRAKVLLALRESVKGGLVADPDMCECVKTRLSDLVDLFWDDLTISVEKAMDDAKEATLGQVPNQDVDTLAELGVEPCLLGPRWWRAKLLYHLLPFDLSIFGNFKDPWWWLLMVFMCLPSFSFLPNPFRAIPVRVPFFVVYLICVVTGYPADEFQLVQYIMSIKGLQFLCSGIGMMCYAAFQYYMCVHPGGTHTCDKSGPGAKQDLLVSVTDWIGTCSLVWIAFLWLPCSERSAGIREIPDSNNTNQTNAGEVPAQNANANTEADGEVEAGNGCCGAKAWEREKGGRLRGWLCYDCGCFIFSLCMCFLLMVIDVGHMRPGGQESKSFGHASKKALKDAVDQADSWTGHAAIYWARVIYALLSFPFLFFWIPGLQGILTHTRITGYNKNGVCVPYMLHPLPDNNNKNGEVRRNSVS